MPLEIKKNAKQQIPQVRNIIGGGSSGHSDTELFETLLENDALKIERIVSTGVASPAGFWYEQTKNEWLTILQGNARLEFEEGELVLNAGDSLLIPAMQRHRVNFTSQIPPCIWLAVFY